MLQRLVRIITTYPSTPGFVVCVMSTATHIAVAQRAQFLPLGVLNLRLNNIIGAGVRATHRGRLIRTQTKIVTMPWTPQVTSSIQGHVAIDAMVDICKSMKDEQKTMAKPYHCPYHHQRSILVEQFTEFLKPYRIIRRYALYIEMLHFITYHLYCY